MTTRDQPPAVTTADPNRHPREVGDPATVKNRRENIPGSRFRDNEKRRHEAGVLILRASRAVSA